MENADKTGAAAPAADGRETILVADDDRLIVATLGAALRAAGYRVIEAFDCPSALDICLARNPALALLDYKMPGGDGVQLAQQITARCAASVVFLTAYADEAIVAGAISAGSMAYLVKPVDPSQLIPTVRVALRRTQEMRALQLQTGRLGGALQTSRHIGIATGLIMATLKVGQHEAFERLRRQARSRRAKVEDVAAGLVQSTDQSNALYGLLAGEKAVPAAPGEPDVPK